MDFISFEIPDTKNLVLKLIFLAVCGLILRQSLVLTGQRWANTYHHLGSYILLPNIALVITTVIKNDIALSLGMIGALSIVRFRNPVKNPFELILYFLLITIGIGMAIRSIYGFGLTFFSIFIILSSNVFKKKYKNLFSLSFSEGRPQHVMEITSNMEIEQLETNKLLIQKIINKIEKNNYEYFYRVSSNEKKEIENINKQPFLKKENIINFKINYFY